MPHTPPTEAPVNVYDNVAVKRHLDNIAAELLLDSDAGLEEDVTWETRKILCMALACASAIAAQFTPFPEKRLKIGLFVCGFFLLNGIVTLIDHLRLKDYFVVFKSVTVKGKATALKLRSTLPRHDSTYTIIVHDENGVELAKSELKTTDYFTRKGECADAYLRRDVFELFRRVGVDINVGSGESKKSM